MISVARGAGLSRGIIGTGMAMFLPFCLISLLLLNGCANCSITATTANIVQPVLVGTIANIKGQPIVNNISRFHFDIEAVDSLAAASGTGELLIEDAGKFDVEIEKKLSLFGEKKIMVKKLYFGSIGLCWPLAIATKSWVGIQGDFY